MLILNDAYLNYATIQYFFNRKERGERDEREERREREGKRGRGRESGREEQGQRAESREQRAVKNRDICWQPVYQIAKCV